MLNLSQNKIRKLSIRSNSYKNASTDQRLMKNIVRSLASQLQDLTANFRTGQNAYLKSNLKNLIC